MSDRLKWLQERQKGIGGSDAAAALGLSHFQTAYELYLDKTTPIIDDDSLSPNDERYWGRVQEEPIIEAYFEMTGYKRAVMPSRTIASRQYPFMRATVDAIAVTPHGGRRNVQAKTSNSRIGWGPMYSDQIPEEYMIQVQHEMAVLDFPVTDVPALLCGNDFRIYTIERDDDMIHALVNAEKQFWDRVIARDPPTPQNLEDCKKRWREAAHKELIEADDYLLDEWRALQTCKAKIKELDRLKDIHEMRLKIAIADMTGIQCDNRKLCSWKNQPSKSVDIELLKTKHPEVYAECMSEKSIRVFRSNKQERLMP